MITVQVGKILKLLTSLRVAVDEVKAKPENDPIPAEDRQRLSAWLCEFFVEPEGLLDNRTQKQLLILVSRVTLYQGYTWSFFAADLADFEDQLNEVIAEVRFAYIPEARAKYFCQAALFGGAVTRAFPSASGDIREAGDCFASGAFTAAVFHLMRAIEHLLRTFVVAVGVPHKGPIPLEYQEWHNLIEQAEERIGKRLGSPWKSRIGKRRAQGILRASIADFYSFKDNVRNHVSHARSGMLDEPSAQGVMIRVQACFERLVPYLSETKKRSLLREEIWAKSPKII